MMKLSQSEKAEVLENRTLLSEAQRLRSDLQFKTVMCGELMWKGHRTVGGVLDGLGVWAGRHALLYLMCEERKR